MGGGLPVSTQSAATIYRPGEYLPDSGAWLPMVCHWQSGQYLVPSGCGPNPTPHEALWHCAGAKLWRDPGANDLPDPCSVCPAACVATDAGLVWLGDGGQ